MSHNHCDCPFHQDESHHDTNWIMAFMIGMVASNLFLHSLPEIFSDKDISVYLISLFLFAGMLLQFILHRFLQPNKHGNQFLWFLNFHNVTDGLSIGLAWLVKPEFGMTVAFGILLHDIIHKSIGYQFLRNQGDSIMVAVIKLATTLISITLGIILTLLIKPGHDFAIIGGAFAAGSLTYVAWVLIKELFNPKTLLSFNSDKKLWLYFFIGAIVMFLVFNLLGHWLPHTH